MATIFAMLQIMNAALVAEGFDEALAENDGTVEWRLLSRNWPLIVEAELEDGNYNFTRQQANLLTRTDGKFGFEDAYQVPAAALHIRRLWTEDEDGNRDVAIEWAQDGEYVYVDEAEGVWVEYAEAADPSFWSANFSRGVQLKMQAILLTFREERSAAQAMDAQAEVHFQRARTNSSRGRSLDQPYRRSRHAQARFGGRG